MCDDLNLPLTLLANLYRITQVANPIVDLDLVVEELLEGRNIKDLVRGGLGGIDDELLERAPTLAIACGC